MSGLVLAVLVVGVTTTAWSLVGLCRLAAAAYGSVTPAHPGTHRRTPHPPTPEQVAILVAAHDEELVVEQTVRSATRLVAPTQVYIVSDGSQDRTVELARRSGAHVLDLQPNRGKAGALAAGIEHFGLCDRYEVVMLLDADTQPADDYLTTALPLFADPEVVAVAGRARTIFEPASPTLLGRFLVAYRERLYVVVQLLLKYGQAARPANAVPIVPGFASLYRSRALREIDVAAPGLVIEDFNMTFEVHRKRLGRIAFHPAAATAYTQDPDRFRDYRLQVRRWLLGFWQTVRLHGVHRGVFWAALWLFVVELVGSCLVWLLVLPLLACSLVASALVASTAAAPGWLVWLAGLLSVRDVLLGVLLPDLLMTLLAAISTRRAAYLLYAVGFPALRVVDAALCLAALARAWAGPSTGRWVSPARRRATVTSSSPSTPAPPADGLPSATGDHP
ncbi:glycosyltransferase family 2 protein [Arsenicicoccus sp. oral taxon 190]|uniref:glycosyltransferase family 2 protein n=1 Tax=Arsenicicoccus sp. oral taxon 190 TaxID=1658671 RepID=UPI0009E1E059|nr:glycosyltransferase family 2 protein [Arsenicicoccus sp. oral taxon 190]